MNKKLKKVVRPTDSEIEDAVEKYFNMLFKLCFAILSSSVDAEDAVSETFEKYITKSPVFNDEQHRRAWLITVASNICKNRFKRRKNYINIDDLHNLAADEKDFSILDDTSRLPIKYKTVLYLHYIEGYKISEISKILKISVSAVKKRLQYAREKLKIEYEKDNL